MHLTSYILLSDTNIVVCYVSHGVTYGCCATGKDPCILVCVGIIRTSHTVMLYLRLNLLGVCFIICVNVITVHQDAPFLRAQKAHARISHSVTYACSRVRVCLLFQYRCNRNTYFPGIAITVRAQLPTVNYIPQCTCEYPLPRSDTFPAWEYTCYAYINELRVLGCYCVRFVCFTFRLQHVPSSYNFVFLF